MSSKISPTLWYFFFSSLSATMSKLSRMWLSLSRCGCEVKRSEMFHTLWHHCHQFDRLCLTKIRRTRDLHQGWGLKQVLAFPQRWADTGGNTDIPGVEEEEQIREWAEWVTLTEVWCSFLTNIWYETERDMAASIPRSRCCSQSWLAIQKVHIHLRLSLWGVGWGGWLLLYWTLSFLASRPAAQLYVQQRCAHVQNVSMYYNNRSIYGFLKILLTSQWHPPRVAGDIVGEKSVGSYRTSPAFHFLYTHNTRHHFSDCPAETKKKNTTSGFSSCN